MTVTVLLPFSFVQPINAASAVSARVGAVTVPRRFSESTLPSAFIKVVALREEAGTLDAFLSVVSASDFDTVDAKSPHAARSRYLPFAVVNFRCPWVKDVTVVGSSKSI